MSPPPWEKPAPPERLTPARLRRGFRNIRPTAAIPAGAPKPGQRRSRSATGGQGISLTGALLLCAWGAVGRMTRLLRCIRRRLTSDQLLRGIYGPRSGSGTLRTALRFVPRHVLAALQGDRWPTWAARSAYLPRLAMRRIADLYPGEVKTNAAGRRGHRGRGPHHASHRVASAARSWSKPVRAVSSAVISSVSYRAGKILGSDGPEAPRATASSARKPTPPRSARRSPRRPARSCGGPGRQDQSSRAPAASTRPGSKRNRLALVLGVALRFS